MLFIMRGTSCSGKDTFIHTHFPNQNHVLSSDNFREMLLGDRSSQQHNARVFDMMTEILEIRFINKVNWTVLNATHLRIRDCNQVIELCKKHHVPFTFISIEPPSVEELVERNRKRWLMTGMNIPESVLTKHHERYYNNLENFHKEAIHNPLCTFIEIDQQYKVKHELS